ncbi:two-component system sensor histidine kinase QseC [Cricetibacter osteomyelitidis]|uniref:Sensor protein QseC n=2 Tax=Cricetibacter osteomyelitidis TaxID=1521931 RepID=A0A4R2SZ15_9PAST|nr:two-component system sensor histidine kinase QseC [Cricetibacter osteomyelitidis]
MKTRSLRVRLILFLSVAALCLWGIATAIAWRQAAKEINELFDTQQILFAERLTSSDMNTLLLKRNQRGGFRPFHRGAPGRPKLELDDDALAFAVFTRNGEILVSDGRNGENFFYKPVRGFSVTEIYGDDDKWRIFWLPTPDHQLMVAVGQELDYRKDLVEKMVLSQMWIWLLGLPFLFGVIYFVVTKEMKSFRRVTKDLESRSPDAHHLLSTENLPTEALPLVNNLNEFFSRTSNTLLRERRFTSDAAHELRSPLAALRIQTELAQMAGDDTKMRNEALNHLTQGIDRATQLVEQLLTLSRLDALNELDNLEHIHWDKIIESLIGERYFIAQKRHIELVFENNGISTLQQGQPLLISLMLRNLIDNAIKYCSEHSTIKVILDNHQVVVEDNGGGVSDDDLAKLGQRFYRPAGQNEKGSGLGLSIVHRIAELHHYKVRLENVKNNQDERIGLRVAINLR